MDEENCDVGRLYRVLEYVSHRLAEMNSVLGRLQAVAGVFCSAGLAGLLVLLGLEVESTGILIAAALPLIWLAVFSMDMFRVSLTTGSTKERFGPTPWFYKDVIRFDPDKATAYTLKDFEQDALNYKSMIESSDVQWTEYCISQIVQLFISTSKRNRHILRMTLRLKVGLVGLVVVTVLSLIVFLYVIQPPPS